MTKMSFLSCTTKFKPNVFLSLLQSKFPHANLNSEYGYVFAFHHIYGNASSCATLSKITCVLNPLFKYI